MTIAEIRHGDCRDVLAVAQRAGELYHAVVTDPPYHLTSITKRFGKDGSAPAKYGRDGSFARLSKGFMSKTWDGGDVAFQPETWRAVWDVLHPGAHMVVFGGTRTYHRLVCAVEDAGFEVRDCLQWLYGTGFAKSHNLKRSPVCSCEEQGNALPYRHGKQTPEHRLRSVSHTNISSTVDDSGDTADVLQHDLPEQSLHPDGAEGAEPKVGAGEKPGLERWVVRGTGQRLPDDPDAESSPGEEERVCPGTPTRSRKETGPTVVAGRGGTSLEPREAGQSAREFDGLRQSPGTLDDRTLPGRGECPRCGKLKAEFVGWGTALKPAHELILLARKPLIGTVAQNVLATGCGGLNIDGCRVPGNSPGSREGEPSADRRYVDQGATNFAATPGPRGGDPGGRWPPNVLLSPLQNRYALRDDVTADQKRELYRWLHENA